MKKREALAHLREAKAYLVQWKSHIQGFTLGLPVDARHLPLIHTDSPFSKWFYNEAQEMHDLQGFDSIEMTILECFNRFQALHKLVKSEPEKGGLFTSQKKMADKRKKQIEEQAELVFTSIKDLIEYTKQLERAATKMPDEEFEQLL